MIILIPLVFKNFNDLPLSWITLFCITCSIIIRVILRFYDEAWWKQCTKGETTFESGTSVRPNKFRHVINERRTDNEDEHHYPCRAVNRFVLVWHNIPVNNNRLYIINTLYPAFYKGNLLHICRNRTSVNRT